MGAKSWKQLVAAERVFYEARQDYVRNSLDASDIQGALRDPAERGVALRLLLSLDPAYSEQFLTDLIELASVGHSDIALVRDVIARFYRPSLEDQLERLSSMVLAHADSDEEYRRFAELFAFLGSRGALKRIVERCRRHASPDIVEIADDFEGI